MPKHLILDLETCPIDDVTTYLEPQSAPSNYKDEDKKRAYIAAAEAEAADKAALDPDLCRIAALGYWIDADPVVLPCKTDDDERVALLALLVQLKRLDSMDGKVITFFGLKFDLPVVLARCFYLGLQAPSLQIDRWRHHQVRDLWQERSFNEATKGHSLQFYCQRLGLGPFDDGLQGKEVPQAIREGRWDEVTKHCEADLRRTHALAQRMGLL